MGDTTKIEWADHTASPWYGCSHAVLSDGSEHEGCANCYAEALAKRNPAILGVWGTEGTRVKSKSFSRSCEAWNKQAERDGVRRSVFPSLCDPFESLEAWDGPLNSWRAGLFDVIDNCPWLDFLLLTKRPQNVRKMWPNMLAARPMFPGMPGKLGQPMPCIVTQPHRKNVWLLASVSNQRTADEMIPDLLGCRDLVPVLGLSMEPLLGPVDLTNLRGSSYEWRDVLNGIHVTYSSQQKCDTIDWVIVGGESGHSARPMHPDWVRSIRDQCQAAGVPLFFKQWGEHLPFDQASTKEQRDAFSAATKRGEQSYFGARVVGGPQGLMTGTTQGVRPVSYAKIGKGVAGRLLDGGTWDEFPKAGAP